MAMEMEAFGLSRQTHETTSYLYNMTNAHVRAAMIRKRCHDGRVSWRIKVQGSRRRSVAAGCCETRSQHSSVFGHTSPQFNLPVSSYPRPWKIKSPSAILCVYRPFYSASPSVHTARYSETRYLNKIQPYTIIYSDTQDGTVDAQRG
jgi:hypothetical protein